MAVGRDSEREERRAGARPLRALVLDAHSESRAEIGRALEALRVTALGAADGASGLALLLDELLELDALVVAAELPGRDAASFTRLVRGPGGERDLAIVVLADGAAPPLRAELGALGADAVIDRAAGPAAVADAVVEAVRGRQAPCEDCPEVPRAAPAAAVDSVERWTLAPLGPLLPA